MRPPSVYKYKLLFKQLEAFALDKGLRYITECDIETLRKFRETWPNKNLRTSKKLYKLAEVNNGHAHHWRDTFSMELLLAGPLLLGHHSVKVTERHYSPFVKARQEQLEAGCTKHFFNHQTGYNYKWPSVSYTKYNH